MLGKWRGVTTSWMYITHPDPNLIKEPLNQVDFFWDDVELCWVLYTELKIELFSSDFQKVNTWFPKMQNYSFKERIIL